MIMFKELSWWYWAFTAVLLIAGLAGWSEGFYLATALSTVQAIHFRLREGSVKAFPVQVRIAYTALLLMALWEPMNWLFWVPAIGTVAQVLFGYCTLARCLSLLAWNRREPLSWRLVWRTFTMPPVKGNILQGLPAIKGILFDLDGVLYVGSRAIAGAVEAVERIRAGGFACRFITNTSTLSLASLQHKINALGFAVPTAEIISARQAALLYLKSQPDPICRLLLADDVKQDFQELRQSDTEANYIVVGDIGDAWSYRLLNEVFNRLIGGAKLIAIHKNRFWQTESGLQMDIGAFVDALEYASGVRAMIIGKPAADFFQIALDDMGLKPSQAAIVGDDIDTDVGGGQQAGLRGVLVRTGKYRQAYCEASAIKPDLIVDSISDMPQALGL